MPSVTFLPDGISIKVRVGTTLLEASRKARVSVRTRCGGVASCLMCKVRVTPEEAAALHEPEAKERHKIGSLLADGIRLSCQARVKSDVTVHVPEDPLKVAIRKQLEEQNRERDELW